MNQNNNSRQLQQQFLYKSQKPPQSSQMMLPNQQIQQVEYQQENGDYTNGEDEESFKVYVRVRPLNSKELAPLPNSQRKNMSIVKIQDNMIHIHDTELMYDYGGKRDKTYCFDQVFNDQICNQDVYNQTLQPLIVNILDGFNVTCFAYGMTGAGKTHTMIGHTTPDVNGTGNGLYNMGVADMGLYLQAANGLFLEMNKRQLECRYILKVSYLEIYNEQVRDLLCDSKSNLMIVEDPTKGVVVPDLQEHQVASLQELLQLILQGNLRRTMAPTQANTFSSRSHSLLLFSLVAMSSTSQVVLYSKLQLIDLAGSERAATTENRGQRMVEGANINRSLLALGNCINILSESKGKNMGSFVPYRDSKLTRLLKDSLGGNTKTIMIACVSPAFSAYEETVNTLKYATRAKKIQRKTKRNTQDTVEMHVSQYKELIDSLKGEIEFLRAQIRQQSTTVQLNSSTMSVSPIRTPGQTPMIRNCANQEDTKRMSAISQGRVTGITSGKNSLAKHSQGTSSPINTKQFEGVKYKQPQNSQRQMIHEDFKRYESPIEITELTSSMINDPQDGQLFEIEQQIFKTQKNLDVQLNLSGSKQQISSKVTTRQQQNISSQSPCTVKSNINFSSRSRLDMDKQKTTIENNIQQDDDENCFEKLSSNLLSNFEENWELQQSINELNELQSKNSEQLELLKNEVIELENQRLAKEGNPQLHQQIQRVLQFKNNEIRIIEKNHLNNIQILNEMKIALVTNADQKQKLQEMLLKIHSSKKKDLLELQIQMRKLKLEKTDLHLQNLQMRKINQEQEREKKTKDQKLQEMKMVIETMQKQIREKDGLLELSKKELMKKEKEIQQIKSHKTSSSTQQVHIAYQTFQQSSYRQSLDNKSQSNIIPDVFQIDNKSKKDTCVFGDVWTSRDEETFFDCHSNTISAQASSRGYLNKKQEVVKEQASPIGQKQKLIMSGFFEDDFQGEIQQNKGLNSIPSTLNIVSSMLEKKRQSHDVRGGTNIQNNSNNESTLQKNNKSSNRKGFTPNNRYKQEDSPPNQQQSINLKTKIRYNQQQLQNSGKKKQNLSISQITVNLDSNQSEILAYEELFPQKQSDQHINNKKPQPIEDMQPPFVAQINLYIKEQPKQSKQPITNKQNQERGSSQSQSKNQKPNNRNQRYLNEPQSNQNSNKVVKYESRRKEDDDQHKKGSNQKQQTKNSKLNRYLSFNNRQATKEESQIVDNRKSFISKNKERQSDQEESEKENNYRMTNQKTEQLQLHSTYDQEKSQQLSYNNYSKTFYNENIKMNNNNPTSMSPEQKLKQATSGLKGDSYSSKFEQRKYSQQISANNQKDNSNIQDKQHQQSASNHRKQSSNDLTTATHQSLLSNSSTFQSYAQIRRASKERQQLKGMSPQASNSLQLQSSSQQIAKQSHSNQKPATNSSIQYKIDLSKDNLNHNKIKASAAATISKYVPIVKPIQSHNSTNALGGLLQGGPFISNEININNNKQAYYDNVLKRKTNQPITFGHNQNSLGGSSNRVGAMKALNIGSPLIQSYQKDNMQQMQPQIQSSRTLQGQSFGQIRGGQNDLIKQSYESEQFVIQQLSPQSQQRNNLVNSSMEDAAVQQLDSLSQSGNNTVKNNLTELMRKQKEQLNKDKEKMQKNKTLFSTSFGSAIANLQSQIPQTERMYQSSCTYNTNNNERNKSNLKQRYHQTDNMLAGSVDDVVEGGEDEFDERGVESPDRKYSEFAKNAFPNGLIRSLK